MAAAGRVGTYGCMSRPTTAMRREERASRAIRRRNGGVPPKDIQPYVPTTDPAVGSPSPAKRPGTLWVEGWGGEGRRGRSKHTGSFGPDGHHTGSFLPAMSTRFQSRRDFR